MSDFAQCFRAIFPSLRHFKGVIDFYMSIIVFSKKMKEFSHKLFFSRWDIARAKTQPTTEFNGTNDNKYILSLFVSQCDLLQQFHTNVAVFDYLLRPENSFRHAISKFKSESLDAKSLLQIIIDSKLPVRVILDVRTQILE